VKIYMKTYILVTTFLLLVGSASAGGVEDTWRKRVQVEPQGVTGSVPVVVFLHGCDGLGAGPGALYPDTRAWVQTITQAGYRFVAPDSWARGTWSRPNSCPGQSGPQPTLETRLTVRSMRIAEIGYAVARLQEDPTVDQKRIVALGHSEGGLAIATSTPPPGVRAEIISGWTCHSSVALGMGIAAPPSIPVLALGFERDTTTEMRPGKCSEFFPGRTDAHEFIAPGSGHMIGGVAGAQQAVVDFLGSLR
jgi:dienelactone hydrolase